MRRILTAALFLIVPVAQAAAQQAAPAPAAPAAPRAAGGARGRPPLFFREEWKQNEKNDEHPVSQDSIANPNLELKLYGTTSKEVQLTGRATDENNPIHVWTGTCSTPCAVALREKNNFADLSGLARIRWVTKMSGFHQVRPIVKLADGTWLVGDRADGSTVDWLTSDIPLADVRWLKLDINNVLTKGTFVEKPDLTKVDEIGFVDLIPGSGHGAGGWSDVGAIEVYAKPVKRQ